MNIYTYRLRHLRKDENSKVIFKGEKFNEKEVRHLLETVVKTNQVTVTSVTDADTIIVSLAGKTETIRLIGVDAPETVHPSRPVEPYGPEASAFTMEQLNGKTVYLELDIRERDRFGRLLAYVWMKETPGDTKADVKAHMFNAWLLLFISFLS